MNDKIRLVYLDEDEGWQSQAHSILKNDFQLHIPQYMPQKYRRYLAGDMRIRCNKLAFDYRLNNTGGSIIYWR